MIERITNWLSTPFPSIGVGGVGMGNVFYQFMQDTEPIITYLTLWASLILALIGILSWCIKGIKYLKKGSNE